ncbi:MAG: hypothetical protein DCE92_01930 [Alphaproteobacteria bacterium]|nr:MAG: hypothetical protein DCE92_01930 [Alphaproteobacteria bacterium]
MNLELSHHAGMRMNQRGIPMDLLERVIAHADIEASVGRGCTSFSVSRQHLKDRDVRRSFGGSVDQASKIAVICSQDGAIITVLKDRGAAGRRYRGRA